MNIVRSPSWQFKKKIKRLRDNNTMAILITSQCLSSWVISMSKHHTVVGLKQLWKKTKTRGGSFRAARTSSNIEKGQIEFERSLRISAQACSWALWMSKGTVRWILYKIWTFTNKIAVVQKLRERDFAPRFAFSEAILRKINKDPGTCVLTSGGAYFHLNHYVLNRIFVIGPQLTFKSLTNGLCTEKG